MIFTWYYIIFNFFSDSTDIHSSGRLLVLESGSLLIASAESSDVGKYTCIRENTAGSIKGSGFLTVLGMLLLLNPFFSYFIDF